MNYPKRGCMSEDGKLYTHTDGSVHEMEIGSDNGCHVCSVYKSKESCLAECLFSSHFRLVEGAYVPSDEDREALDMARAAIQQCNVGFGTKGCLHGATCFFFVTSSCHLRMYLASKRQPDAWEVRP